MAIATKKRLKKTPGNPRLRSLKAFFVRVLTNLAVLVMGVAIALICGEMLVRYTAPQKLYRFPKGMFVNHPSLRYRLTPNFRGVAKTFEYETSIHINSQGLREDREYGQKPPGTFRILAIGDSFTMGVGVELQDTFVKDLERLLNSDKGGQKYEVINSGVPGYNTRQEFIYLREEGLKLKPDLVMLNFYIGNDIYENIHTSRLSVIDGYLQHDPPPKGILPYKLRLLLARKSHLYQFIWPYQRRFFDWIYSRDSHRPKGKVNEKKNGYFSIYLHDIGENTPESDMWKQTQNQIRNIAKLLKDNSVKLLVVVIPEPIQIKPEKWTKTVSNIEKNVSSYQLDNPNKKVFGFCIHNGIPTLDLLPFFTSHQHEERLYFELDGHWVPRGNHLAAESVHKFLLDSGSRLLKIKTE